MGSTKTQPIYPKQSPTHDHNDPENLYARSPVTENLVLSWTRFTGLLATVATIIAVIMVFLRDKWRNLRARLRKHHIVVVGANRFTLDRYEAYGLQSR